MKYLVSIFSRLRFTSESIQLKMAGEEQGLGVEEEMLLESGGDAVGKRRSQGCPCVTESLRLLSAEHVEGISSMDQSWF